MNVILVLTSNPSKGYTCSIRNSCCSLTYELPNISSNFYITSSQTFAILFVVQIRCKNAAANTLIGCTNFMQENNATRTHHEEMFIREQLS